MKVKDLKDDMHNVSVVVKVVSVSQPKTVQTRNGETTIREAVVEDDSGRVKLTIWGDQQIKPGTTVKIENAWTSTFKGEVKLNVSNKSKITTTGEQPTRSGYTKKQYYPKQYNGKKQYYSSKSGYYNKKYNDEMNEEE